MSALKRSRQMGHVSSSCAKALGTTMGTIRDVQEAWGGGSYPGSDIRAGGVEVSRTSPPPVSSKGKGAVGGLFL